MEDRTKFFADYSHTACSHDVEIPEEPVSFLLKRSAKLYQDHTALSFYGKKLNYAELYKNSLAFASALQNKGLKKGDRVAIMLPNCPQYVIAFFGILQAGGIVTQVNPLLVERELDYILKDSGANMIVAFDAVYELVKKVQPETKVKQVITVSLQKPFTPPSQDQAFEDFIQTATPSFIPPHIDAKHDVAVLQYTGGTTGRSKGVMLTHYNLVANVIQSAEVFKTKIGPGEDISLAVAPYFHIFGLTTSLTFPVYFGNELIIVPRFDVDEILQIIEKEKPTVFPGVPTMYVALTNHPKVTPESLKSLWLCNSGSAPMPVELLKRFEKMSGAMIVEGYGLSETSPVATCNPIDSVRKPGSVGMGVPKTAIKIVDIATGKEELGANELGEVVISGPQVMKGYWNNDEETAIALRDGWFYTGDIGRLDEEGYLYIVDRKKDMIIASGFNIYPRDIEEVLYEHPAIQEAVVIGIPDQYRGETVKAVLVFKENRSASEEEMIEYCKERLSAYKVPTIFEFRTELPKTNVGKILRRALREEVTKQ
ncbi:long-chain fatty acid--CoA ligase [Bacillus carboniphilus]|uniref:Long-chain fatty acid--CoA ligase n=1 Tax=Bacillus carboniphilus TaxID=86663 RepID=A0ABY9JUT9_9BACI|nr:long-chain fatty acid--CoA ligase [Bacillus carboniphilus]WLR43177.1 long-chain fatty acid--CoA ligase [Bacillus carboniphilus]